MRVLLADRQAKVRSALRLLLTHELQMQVVGEAVDLPGVRAQIEVVCPDLLLVDWNIFDGQVSATLLALRSLCPHLLVVALSGRGEERQRALAAGMDGFVSKAASATQVVTALRGLHAVETPSVQAQHTEPMKGQQHD